MIVKGESPNWNTGEQTREEHPQPRGADLTGAAA
jgi:hypothetical protein